MKTNAFTIAGLAWTALLLAPAHAAEATIVAAPRSDCSDYFVVNTGDRYALLEWFGGPVPAKGDKIAGTFDRFGVQDLAVLPDNGTMRVWLEDYDLTEDDANDKLKDKCP